MTKVILDDTGKYSIEEVLKKLREMGVECRVEGEEEPDKVSRLSNLTFGLWADRDIDATELRRKAWGNRGVR